MSEFKNLSQEKAKQRMNQEKDIILLDVRTEGEYKEKHIPNSILIPVEKIEDEADNILDDKDATIFVYCRSGRKSVIASVALTEMGYSNVYNIGGINEWPYEIETAAK